MLEILDAAAGAGKTYALAQRFLTLLAKAHDDPFGAPCLPSRREAGFAFGDILAITFTNKAAAEMQERVLRFLKERALSPSSAPPSEPAAAISPEQARLWLEILVRRLDRLNIRTIDSLLHRVLRLGALELGLPPNVELEFDDQELFDPLFATLENQADDLGEQAEELQALMDSAQEAMLHIQGCKRFLPTKTFRGNLTDVFTFMLRNPLRLQSDGEPVRIMLQNLLTELRRTVTEMRGFITSEKLAAAKNFLGFLDKLDNVGLYDDIPKSAYSSKEILDECLNKASKGMASSGAADSFLRLRKACGDMATLGPSLRKAQSLTHMVAVCRRLLQTLEIMQRVRGVTPMARLPRMAHTLLADNACVTESLCRMGNSLQHLLLDEFQDTSREQWESLEPLCEEALAKGGSLFYVGDIKQAIYGWRGGDAQLFNEVEHSPALAHLLTEPASREALPCNWRSAETIVRFNNDFFGQLKDQEISLRAATAMLPAVDTEEQGDTDAVMELAASIRQAYEKVEQDVAPPHRGVEGLVQLRDIRAGKKEELLEKVRTHLKELLQDLKPRFNMSDLAILVRKNDEAEAVAQWLIEWGYAVITENSLLLGEHPMVRQLVALATFLDYPRDDVAFLDLISGRELFLDSCGMPSGELYDWLPRRSKGPLYLAFRKDFPELWDKWISPLFSRGGFMSAYDVFSDAMRRFSLRQRFPRDVIYCNRLLETVHKAESEGAQSLAAFLELWRQCGDKQKVPLPENLDAIRVLTIHKSKGLQFPVVIVPFHHAGKPPRDSLIAWHPPGSDPLNDPPLLTPLSMKLGKVWYEHALPYMLETINLIYVAWTRAERELHCFITSADNYERQSPQLKALRVLLERFGLDGDGAEFIAGAPQAGAPPEKREEAPLPRPPEPEALSDPMGWLPGLKIFRSELRKESFAERRRGTLAHRCMEYLRVRDGVEQDVECALRAGLRGMSDPHDPAFFGQEQATLHDELRGLLTWARTHPQLQECLTHGAGEQEILTETGAIRRMDLLATIQERHVAVEYKTGAETPEHRNQLREYLRLLHGLPQETAAPPKGLLVYLDQRRIQEVEL